MSTVTVLSGPERRRRWSAAEKLRIVEASLAPGARVVEVARRHDVHPNLLHLWRRQAQGGELVGGLARRSTPGDRPQFAPVVIAPGDDGTGAARVAGDAIEVMLRNGRVMRVPEHVALSRVARLADALEERAR